MEALDPLALKFVEAEDKAAVIAEAEAIAAAQTGDEKLNADIYVKFMQRATEKVRCSSGRAESQGLMFAFHPPLHAPVLSLPALG